MMTYNEFCNSLDWIDFTFEFNMVVGFADRQKFCDYTGVPFSTLEKWLYKSNKVTRSMKMALYSYYSGFGFYESNSCEF